jgi:hypothetical protein
MMNLLEETVCMNTGNRDTVGIRIIGLGRKGISALKLVHEYFNARLSPEYLANLSLIHVSKSGRFSSLSQTVPGEIVNPDLLVLLVDIDDAEDISKAHAIGTLALQRKILTLAVTSGNLYQNREALRMLYTSAHAVSDMPDKYTQEPETINHRMQQTAIALTARLMMPGLIGLDFYDLASAMLGTIDNNKPSIAASVEAPAVQRRLVFGVGSGDGPYRAMIAARTALSDANVKPYALAEPFGMVIIVSHGMSMTQYEFYSILEYCNVYIQGNTEKEKDGVIAAGDRIDKDARSKLEVVLLVSMPETRLLFL